MERAKEIKNRKVFPQKPIIRKLGTISCNCIVETTPIHVIALLRQLQLYIAENSTVLKLYAEGAILLLKMFIGTILRIVLAFVL